jgi:hypothetical protein
MSKNLLKMSQSILGVTKKALREDPGLRDRFEPGFVARHVAELEYAVAHEALKRNMHDVARGHTWEALKHSPGSFMYWKTLVALWLVPGWTSARRSSGG